MGPERPGPRAQAAQANNQALYRGMDAPSPHQRRRQVELTTPGQSMLTVGAAAINSDHRAELPWRLESLRGPPESLHNKGRSFALSESGHVAAGDRQYVVGSQADR